MLRRHDGLEERCGVLVVGRHSFQGSAFLGPTVVPAVFDGLFGTTREKLADLHPLVSQSLLCLGQDPIFFIRPRCCFDIGVNVVDESFPELFRGAALEPVDHIGPFQALVVELNDQFIFLCGKWPAVDIG